VDFHHDYEAEKPRISGKYCKLTASPYLVRQMLKWFYDTSTGAATGATRCGSFMGKAFSLLVVSSRQT
jgi:hypothetical protein